MTPSPTPTEEPATATATIEPTPTPAATPTLDLRTPTESPEAVESQARDLLGETYSNPAEGFQIRPPGGWGVDESGLLGTTVIFRNETPDLHDEAPFNANMNVVTATVRELTLEEIVASTREQFKTMLTDFTLLEETFLVVDDLDAHAFEYTFTQGVFPLRATQLIVVHEDTAYAITAGSLSAAWDKYEDAFDASLRTLRILPGSSPATRLDQPISDPTNGFEISPPYQWVVDQSGLSGTKLALFHQEPEYHGETPFNANILVFIYPAEGLTLQEFVALSKEESPLVLTNYVLLEEESATVNDREVHLFESTFSQEEFPVRALQLLSIHEDQIFIVTAIALEDSWDKYEAVFDASLRSFRILPRSPTRTESSAPADSQPAGLLDAPYSDSTNGFEIRPPRDWTADRSGLLGTKVAFLNPEPDLQGRSPFSANIVIYVEPAEGLTLEELVEMSNEQSPLLLKDYALLADETDTVNGQAVRFLDATFTHGVYSLRIRQLVAIYEDKSYVITTTALDAAWQQYEAVFDASLRSFRILDTEDSEDS